MNGIPPDGIVIVAKRECETCQMVEPVLGQVADKLPTLIFSQDDPSFPEIGAVDDRSLEIPLPWTLKPSRRCSDLRMEQRLRAPMGGSGPNGSE
jgi:hypothetical protein